MKASLFHSLPKEIISHIKDYNKSKFKVLVYMVNCDHKFNEISMDNISIHDCLKMTEINEDNLNKIALINRKDTVDYIITFCNSFNEEEADSSYISIKYNNKSVVIKLHTNKQYLKNKKHWYVSNTLTLKYANSKYSYDHLDDLKKIPEVWKFSPRYYLRSLYNTL